MVDKFLSLSAMSEGYYMDRGSKFLAYAFPVSSESDGMQELQKIKKSHPKARHFCTAIRLLPDGSFERFNDDGEPSGSAGRPILGQLIKYDLTEAMIVVVRYFGGTKLGVPGLIEAYKTSAANALEASNIIKRKIYSTFKLTLAYEQLPLMINHFKQLNIPVFQTDYDEQANMIIGFARSTSSEAFRSALQHYTQRDFLLLDDYLMHLNMQVESLEDKIL